MQILDAYFLKKYKEGRFTCLDELLYYRNTHTSVLVVEDPKDIKNMLL